LFWFGGDDGGWTPTDANPDAAAEITPDPLSVEPVEAVEAERTAKTPRRRPRHEQRPTVSEEDRHSIAGTVNSGVHGALPGVEVRVHVLGSESAAHVRLQELRKRLQGRVGGLAGRRASGDDDSGGMPSAETMQEGMEMGMELLEDGSLTELMSNMGSFAGGEFDTPAGEQIGSGTTDDKGAFRIDELPEGSVEVRVSVDGHVQARQIVEVGTLDLELWLSAGAVVDGLVLSEGNVVEGALVRTRTGSFTTGADGRFHFDGVSTPLAQFLVSASGHVAGGFSRQISLEGPNDDVRLELMPAGAVALPDA
jgi:hypothetical protein